jgi:DNA helicase HerA-like ATPase
LAEPIGVVSSPSKVDEFDMILLPGKSARRGEYCTFRHPLKPEIWCLGRIIGGRRANPEILPTALTAVLFKRGFQISPEREVSVLDVEAIGYREGGKFRPMDFPVAPGSEVYPAGPERVREFVRAGEGVQIPVGTDPYSGIEISLSLDIITKGHLAICGMTRSGKSTFALTFIREACRKGARFLIFDRTGEYVQPLQEAGVRCEVVDPSEFRGLSSITDEQLASMFGLTLKRSSGRALAGALRELLGGGKELKVEEVLPLCEGKITRFKETTLGEIKQALERHREDLEKLAKMREEPLNVIEALKRVQAVIVDLSRERSIENQQVTVASVLDQVFTFATSTRGEELTFLVVLEEAQFYAPERVVSYGNPQETGSLDAVTAGLSQLGGFNVGFIVMSQRPAYVSKSVLSQCNTFLSFRLMSSADHEQIAGVTGYPQYRVASLLSGLEDHVGYLMGMGSPLGFPTFIETTAERIYPRKATKSPSEVLRLAP